MLTLKYRDYDYYLSRGMVHKKFEDELINGLRRITPLLITVIVQTPHDFSSVEYRNKIRKMQKEEKESILQKV